MSLYYRLTFVDTQVAAGSAAFSGLEAQGLSSFRDRELDDNMLASSSNDIQHCKILENNMLITQSQQLLL